MALQPKKTAKTKLPSPASSSSSDDEDDEAPAGAVASSDDSDDSDDEAPDASVEEIKAPEASVSSPDESVGEIKPVDGTKLKVKKEALVVVTMHETIEPPPRVGDYNCKERLGVTKLEQRKAYRLPKFVADVLVDAKKAEIVNI